MNWITISDYSNDIIDLQSQIDQEMIQDHSNDSTSLQSQIDEKTMWD
jgi:hypothetical protein